MPPELKETEETSSRPTAAALPTRKPLLLTRDQAHRLAVQRRAHKHEAAQPLPPMTGAQAMAYWKRVGALGVYSDRAVYPQDAPELARILREREEKSE